MTIVFPAPAERKLLHRLSSLSAALGCWEGLCRSRASSTAAATVLSLLAWVGGLLEGFSQRGACLGQNRGFFFCSWERGRFILEYQCLIQVNPLGKWSEALLFWSKRPRAEQERLAGRGASVLSKSEPSGRKSWRCWMSTGGSAAKPVSVFLSVPHTHTLCVPRGLL